MADVFSDIEFLAGSPNRAAVLEALVDTPRDRHDLAEHVGVSRVTIGRILKDLVARGWVASDGSRYWATPIGEVVATEFGALLNTMETMRKLSAVMEWLPPDLDIDFRRFADARITLPTWSDSVAPIFNPFVTRWDTSFRRAGSFRTSPVGETPDFWPVISDGRRSASMGELKNLPSSSSSHQTASRSIRASCPGASVNE